MIDIGKPFPPARRFQWPEVNDIVVATDGPDAMRGTVLRIDHRQSCTVARVKWSNGSIGRHTITTLRRWPLSTEEAP